MKQGLPVEKVTEYKKIDKCIPFFFCLPHKSFEISPALNAEVVGMLMSFNRGL